MEIVYRDAETDQKYGQPPGRHQAKFLAVELNDPPEFMKNSKFQRKDEERMLYWTFRFPNGEDMVYYTGARATKGSNCLKIMNALSGNSRPADGVFRAEQYVGREYTLVLTLSESGASTYISAILPNEAQTSPPPNPAPKKAAPKPPSPPPPEQTAANGALMYWYMPVKGGQAELGTIHEIQTHIAANGLDPAQVKVCPEDSDKWVTAASVKIEAEIAF
jgi:hypothetical protein